MKQKPLTVASFFNVPLIVGNRVVGLINVSSAGKNAYKEEVTVIYQIIGQATNALIQTAIRSGNRKRQADFDDFKLG
jgi:GAF domain-containing protein